MNPLKSYSNKELQMMRLKLIKAAESDINVFGFTISDIEEEIEFRASNRIPVCDEQQDNPILDRSQSFAPPQSY